MGGIVNLIKKLFSGIFSFVGGLLPGKKSSLPGKKSSNGFYLELSDAEVGKSAPVAAETPKPAAKSKQEAAPAAAEPVKSEPVKVAEKVADIAATNGSKPTASATLNLPQPTVTFADAAATPQPTTARRRPGANMSSYLEMARGMKTAKN